VLRPQRPLQEAALDAARQALPRGLGLDSAPVRQRMVQRLRADGVRCEPLLQAMGQVPRHEFVDSALAAQAYEDTSLPIGLSQTISKPSVVARIIEWLYLGGNARAKGQLGRVLEIGTGCGYQAAVLAQLSTHVVSVERLKSLHELAARHLHRLQVPRCRLVYGDGMRGHPPNAPYDSIISAAGGDDLPPAWLEQLAVGGRLVAPARSADGRGQTLVIVDRHADGYTRRLGEAVQFVPLKSGTH
jgi:protein-L-isoaspartate(D-aspartate) O-methyltransferase